MRKEITDFITAYIREKDKGGIIRNIWRTPIVCFGDARREEMKDLRELVHPEHAMPWEVLPEAKTVIAYFLPFTEEIAKSNEHGRLSSVEWAKAYEKTNAAIVELNEAIVAFLKARGIEAAVPKEAFVYDEAVLKSKWSQRHVAYYCGLGTFGINNMLITDKGTSGRIGTVVTALDVAFDEPLAKERCLYKQDGSCGVCVKRCPSGALTKTGFDRFLCNDLCGENASVHVGYVENSSYDLGHGSDDAVRSNTCGKCVVGVPCTVAVPKKS